MPLFRLHHPDLPYKEETMLVDKLIAAMEFEQCGEDNYMFKIGNIGVWTENRRYADMNIYEPIKIKIGFWNARRLRKAIKKKRAEMISQSMISSPVDVPKEFLAAFR